MESDAKAFIAQRPSNWIVKQSFIISINFGSTTQAFWRPHIHLINPFSAAGYGVVGWYLLCPLSKITPGSDTVLSSLFFCACECVCSFCSSLCAYVCLISVRVCLCLFVLFCFYSVFDCSFCVWSFAYVCFIISVYLFFPFLSFYVRSYT